MNNSVKKMSVTEQTMEELLGVLLLSLDRNEQRSHWPYTK